MFVDNLYLWQEGCLFGPSSTVTDFIMLEYFPNKSAEADEYEYVVAMHSPASDDEYENDSTSLQRMNGNEGLLLLISVHNSYSQICRRQVLFSSFPFSFIGTYS